MSRKYIETSFTSFVKNKLYETIEREKTENTKASEDANTIDNEPDEDSKLMIDKKEMERESFVYELQREFNKIWQEYDNLYGV